MFKMLVKLRKVNVKLLTSKEVVKNIRENSKITLHPYGRYAILNL